jgi:spore germination cell wall hydrolase CwlJ-like protein
MEIALVPEQQPLVAMALDEDGELQLSRAWIVERAERFAPLAAGLMLFAFAGGYLASHGLPGFGARYSLSVAIPPLPVVEPLTLRDVSKAEARRINEAVAITVDPVRPAAPFFASGTPESVARATDCLAATIYYEAGAEPVAGQMAVAQVVLNRVRHPAYPKSVCGVVFQGSERRTGCQFSYTCDGAMNRHPGEAAWSHVRNLARAMLNGVTYTPVGLATHYHTDWVSPAWSAKLDKVRVERTHLFFRYNGYWGSPAAFHGRYTGDEARQARLAALSPGHRAAGEAENIVGPIEEDLELLKATQGIVPDHVSEALPDEAAAADTKGKNVFIIYVDPLLDAESLTALGARACGDRKRCKVLAWADTALMPKGLPLEPQERAAMAFSYIREPGSSRARWNCALFPREQKRDCFG